MVPREPELAKGLVQLSWPLWLLALVGQEALGRLARIRLYGKHQGQEIKMAAECSVWVWERSCCLPGCKHFETCATRTDCAPISAATSY